MHVSLPFSQTVSARRPRVAMEARLDELAALHERGVITDAEYAEARRAALGLGQLSAACGAADDHIVVGEALVVDPSPQSQPVVNPTVTCRCGEVMIHIPAKLALVQVMHGES